MLENGADRKARNQFQATALHFAARSNLKCVTILLDHDTDPNVQNSYGNTPLHRASRPEISTALIEAGANIEAKNKQGMRPIDRAARNGNSDNIKTLANLGAKLTANSRGCSPLTYAIKKKCYNAVEALLEAGADPTNQSVSRYTPCHAAAKLNDATALKLLYDKVGKELLELRDDNQNTPLQLASHPFLIRWFIQRFFEDTESPLITLTVADSKVELFLHQIEISGLITRIAQDIDVDNVPIPLNLLSMSTWKHIQDNLLALYIASALKALGKYTDEDHQTLLQLYEELDEESLISLLNAANYLDTPILIEVVQELYGNKLSNKHIKTLNEELKPIIRDLKGPIIKRIIDALKQQFPKKEGDR